jgi:hypothetical protein
MVELEDHHTYTSSSKPGKPSNAIRVSCTYVTELHRRLHQGRSLRIETMQIPSQGNSGTLDVQDGSTAPCRSRMMTMRATIDKVWS